MKKKINIHKIIRRRRRALCGKARHFFFSDTSSSICIKIRLGFFRRHVRPMRDVSRIANTLPPISFFFLPLPRFCREIKSLRRLTIALIVCSYVRRLYCRRVARTSIRFYRSTRRRTPSSSCVTSSSRTSKCSSSLCTRGKSTLTT